MNVSTYCRIGCLIALCMTSAAVGQDKPNLEPPISTSTLQISRSPDPDALASFRFATAEINDDGKIEIVTKSAIQKLLVEMPSAPASKLDPRGIRFKEEVEKEYTVYRKVIEIDKDGKEVEVSKPEKRTRTQTVVRYRKRTPKEQGEFEKLIAEQKAKQQAGEVPQPIPVTVAVDILSTTTKTEVDENGKKTKVRVVGLRPRELTIQRGKTITEESIDTSVYAIAKFKYFAIDGSELDVETVQNFLAERKPVILVNHANAITPYFQKLLTADTLFVVMPQVIVE